MRVLGVRVSRVVVMVVIVIIIAVMVVVMMVIVFGHDQSAHASTEAVAKGAIGHVRSGGMSTLSFDMVVMAFLYGADLGLETQHLHTVFA